MERFTVSVRTFRRLAIVTTVGICLLVVAGGVVRLTGSGLGCDDWPNCNATSFVDVSTGHAAIEQVNRLFSGLIGLPTLALAIAGFRVRPRRRDLRWPAIGVLAAVLGNGVVGGIAVRGDLHPSLVQSHFLLAMISIAFGVVAVRRSAERAGGGRPPTSLRRGLAWTIGAGTAAALVTGTVVTGTGPHAGDEDVQRFGFDISNVARVHSAAVLATIAVMLAFLLVARRSEPVATTWMLVAVLQGAVGYVQYLNDVPEVLVALHLAGATGLWVATVLFVLDVVGDGAPAPSQPPAPQRAAAMTTGVAPFA